MQQVGDVQLQNADSYFSHYAFLSLEAIKLPTKLATKAFIIYTWQDKANTHPPLWHHKGRFWKCFPSIERLDTQK